MNRETSGAAQRSSDAIEADIGSIRARMEQTLDEIEFRLSPGQMSSGAMHVLRDVMSSDPRGVSAGRLGRVIRDNPIPVALIGIGVTWLAIAVSREGRHLEGMATGHGQGARLLQRQRLGMQLLVLSEIIHEGVELAREAETRVDTPAWRDALREVAEQYDRTAAALDAELEALREPVPERPEPGAVWAPLRGALADRNREEIVTALEEGADATLAAFREVLHQEMPQGMQVLLGAHFHDMETAHNRLVTLKEVVA
ncbi:MAG TPA: DUF3618 domain-containing protein [Azospirillaceae bacterium]|nr:DUF3618 domain-containing protein [Azospirillaceae bacterium]